MKDALRDANGKKRRIISQLTDDQRERVRAKNRRAASRSRAKRRAQKAELGCEGTTQLQRELQAAENELKAKQAKRTLLQSRVSATSTQLTKLQDEVASITQSNGQHSSTFAADATKPQWFDIRSKARKQPPLDASSVAFKMLIDNVQSINLLHSHWLQDSATSPSYRQSRSTSGVANVSMSKPIPDDPLESSQGNQKHLLRCHPDGLLVHHRHESIAVTHQAGGQHAEVGMLPDHVIAVISQTARLESSSKEGAMKVMSSPSTLLRAIRHCVAHLFMSDTSASDIEDHHARKHVAQKMDTQTTQKVGERRNNGSVAPRPSPAAWEDTFLGEDERHLAAMLAADDSKCNLERKSHSPVTIYQPTEAAKNMTIQDLLIKVGALCTIDTTAAAYKSQACPAPHSSRAAYAAMPQAVLPFSSIPSQPATVPHIPVCATTGGSTDLSSFMDFDTASDMMWTTPIVTPAAPTSSTDDWSTLEASTINHHDHGPASSYLGGGTTGMQHRPADTRGAEQHFDFALQRSKASSSQVPRCRVPTMATARCMQAGDRRDSGYKHITETQHSNLEYGQQMLPSRYSPNRSLRGDQLIDLKDVFAEAPSCSGKQEHMIPGLQPHPSFPKSYLNTSFTTSSSSHSHMRIQPDDRWPAAKARNDGHEAHSIPQASGLTSSAHSAHSSLLQSFDDMQPPRRHASQFPPHQNTSHAVHQDKQIMGHHLTIESALQHLVTDTPHHSHDPFWKDYAISNPGFNSDRRSCDTFSPDSNTCDTPFLACAPPAWEKPYHPCYSVDYPDRSQQCPTSSAPHMRPPPRTQQPTSVPQQRMGFESRSHTQKPIVQDQWQQERITPDLDSTELDLYNLITSHPAGRRQHRDSCHLSDGDFTSYHPPGYRDTPQRTINPFQPLDDALPFLDFNAQDDDVEPMELMDVIQMSDWQVPPRDLSPARVTSSRAKNDFSGAYCTERTQAKHASWTHHDDPPISSALRSVLDNTLQGCPSRAGTVPSTGHAPAMSSAPLTHLGRGEGDQTRSRKVLQRELVLAQRRQLTEVLRQLENPAGLLPDVVACSSPALLDPDQRRANTNKVIDGLDLCSDQQHRCAVLWNEFVIMRTRLCKSLNQLQLNLVHAHFDLDRSSPMFGLSQNTVMTGSSEFYEYHSLLGAFVESHHQAITDLLQLRRCVFTQVFNPLQACKAQVLTLPHRPDVCDIVSNVTSAGLDFSSHKLA